MPFDFDAYNSVTGRSTIQLFSLLPSASAASGLQAAAAASKAAQRNATPVDTSGLDVQARLAGRRADNYQRLSAKLDQVVESVTDARDTLLELKEFLSDMRGLVVLSQGSTIDDAERRQHADTFDQLLGKLNLKVQSERRCRG